MADIKREPQEDDHISQDSFIPPFSPPQEHKSGILPATSNSHHEAKREDTPVIVGEEAAQDTPYNPHPRAIHVPSYGMTDSHLPPGYPMPVVQHPYHNVGHVQGVPERQRVIYPANQGHNGEFCYARQRVIPGPTQVAVPYPPAHQAPTRGLPASENLRRLASHYVQHPGSRVNSISMERGTAGRYKVTIALEVSDIL
ncbi:hypothetical protein BGY98DRAFT_957805 [Russula aff. rugulosa BPL654]|nr:hypothetical protein BGY98DRAFT_957805 [Russula aff. rugulosa BPL654]